MRGAPPLNPLELAACKTLANVHVSIALSVAYTPQRNKPGYTPPTRRTKTSTDYTYQIPSEFKPSRDGTFLTGEKNAINFSRSYDAASNS